MNLIKEYKNDNDNNTKLQIADKDVNVRNKDADIKRENVRAKIIDSAIRKEALKTSNKK